VVVAIVTMAALIGFPLMQHALAVLTQRQTVALVAAQVRMARADAVRRDGPVEFDVAPDGRSYGASDGVPAVTPQGVTLSTDPDINGRIRFYGDGSSSGGVIWIHAAGRTAAVRIAPLSGAVAKD
jgi:general secretion pathway protein H